MAVTCLLMEASQFITALMSYRLTRAGSRVPGGPKDEAKPGAAGLDLATGGMRRASSVTKWGRGRDPLKTYVTPRRRQIATRALRGRPVREGLCLPSFDDFVLV